MSGFFPHGVAPLNSGKQKLAESTAFRQPIRSASRHMAKDAGKLIAWSGFSGRNQTTLRTINCPQGRFLPATASRKEQDDSKW